MPFWELVSPEQKVTSLPLSVLAAQKGVTALFGDQQGVGFPALLIPLANACRAVVTG